MQTLYAVALEGRGLPRNNIFYSDENVAFAVLTYLRTRALLDQASILAEDLVNEFAIACRIAYQKYNAGSVKKFLDTMSPLDVYEGLLELGERQRECADPSDVPTLDADIGLATDPLAVFEVKIEDSVLIGSRIVETFDFTSEAVQKLKGFRIFYIKNAEVRSIRVFLDAETVVAMNFEATGSNYYSSYIHVD